MARENTKNNWLSTSIFLLCDKCCALKRCQVVATVVRAQLCLVVKICLNCASATNQFHRLPFGQAPTLFLRVQKYHILCTWRKTGVDLSLPLFFSPMKRSKIPNLDIVSFKAHATMTFVNYFLQRRHL